MQLGPYSPELQSARGPVPGPSVWDGWNRAAGTSTVKHTAGARRLTETNIPDLTEAKMHGTNLSGINAHDTGHNLYLRPWYALMAPGAPEPLERPLPPEAPELPAHF